MNIDIRSIAIVIAITSILQVIAFSLQYSTKKSYPGIGWWLLWSASAALGFIVMLMRDFVSIELIPISIFFTNIFLLAGQVFLYIGIMRFLDIQQHQKIVIYIFAVFILSCFYVNFLHKSDNARVILLYFTGAIISFMAAHDLFVHKSRYITSSANFLSLIFLVHSSYFVFRVVEALTIVPIDEVFSPTIMQAATFLVSLITSYLWAFGLIVMTNQRSNAEMTKAKEHFELIFNTSPDAVLIMREHDGCLVGTNNGFTTLTGFARDEVIGKSSMDINIWENPADREKIILSLKENGFCKNIEIAFKHKNSNQFIGLLSANIINLQGHPHIISFVRDITDCKRLEQELQSRERDLMAIMNNIPSLVGYADKELRCRFVNHINSEWFGIDPDKIIGMHLKDVIGDNNFRMVQSEIAAVLAGQPQTFERSITSVDGSTERYLLTNYIPDISNGHAEGFYVLVSDITSFKLAEEQRKQIAKAESLERMAGAIAHNFNNQLFAVIGNLELLLDEMPLGSDKSIMLTDAMAASHKAVDISKMMLTYLGQSPGKKEIQDLSETCHKGLLMVQPALPKNVSIKTEIPLPGPAVNVNTPQLFQIIINLVTNAWESLIDPQGEITISVKTVSSADVSATNRFPAGWQPKDSSYACIEVFDTGCSIPIENIEKIFDPFFTTKFTGRGLGLSTVLGILVAHNGAINFENRMKGGSIFRVYLPLASKTIPADMEKLTADVKVPSGGVVLLVDDESQVRNMARTMLSRQGYSVLEAADGMEAVEIFRENQDKIDLVLSDLTMPCINGWEALTAFRKISPKIPVILSSGYDEAYVMAGREQCEQPNAFLGKPYQMKELRKTISRVMAEGK